MKKLSIFGAWLSTVSLVVLMVGGFGDVFLRAVRGRGLVGVVEVSESLLVIAAFLGMGLAQQTKSHVATSLVTDRVQPRKQSAMRLVASVISLVFVLVLLEPTAHRAYTAILEGEYRFGIVKVPTWPGRLAVSLGLFFLLLEVLRDAARYFTLARRGKSYARGAGKDAG